MPSSLVAVVINGNLKWLHKFLVFSLPSPSVWRYVICQGLREGADRVANYVFSVNKELCRLSNTPKDILQVCTTPLP